MVLAPSCSLMKGWELRWGGGGRGGGQGRGEGKGGGGGGRRKIQKEKDQDPEKVRETQITTDLGLRLSYYWTWLHCRPTWGRVYPRKQVVLVRARGIPMGTSASSRCASCRTASVYGRRARSPRLGARPAPSSLVSSSCTRSARKKRRTGGQRMGRDLSPEAPSS